MNSDTVSNFNDPHISELNIPIKLSSDLYNKK